MRLIFLLCVLIHLAACSALAPQTTATSTDGEEKIEQISLGTTLEHIFQSYKLGCMEARRELGHTQNFHICHERAGRHLRAVERVLDGPAPEENE